MRLGLKKAVTAAIAIGLLGGALPATTQAGPKRKPKKFTASGLIAGAGLVTHSNFIAQCPDLPASQGVDAYVVEVPMEFGVKPSEATVKATSVSAEPTVELSYYSYGCAQGELYVKAPATVPAGTGFIVVQDIQGGAVDFELTLTQR
ncbi:MAG TPA: hypothetical protein VG318_18785 [Actinomycetota bacterium]|nr:hypothetical protein [Actinomycetota bacterium]